jgi:two-component system response regulator DctR
VDRVIEALALSSTALDTAAGRAQVRRLLDELTEREQEVMRLVVQGRANKQIADELDISVRTVEVHRARVFDKMGVRSAVELANALRTAGLE